jgi:hypothetical protein
LDAWVWANAENAERIIAALNDFGFGDVGVTMSDFLRQDSVVQLGFPPYRIDILTSIDGVLFEEAWQRRFVVNVNNNAIPFICKEDLIKNEIAVGRPQDMADVKRLTE